MVLRQTVEIGNAFLPSLVEVVPPHPTELCFASMGAEDVPPPPPCDHAPRVVAPLAGFVGLVELFPCAKPAFGLEHQFLLIFHCRKQESSGLSPGSILQKNFTPPGVWATQRSSPSHDPQKEHLTPTSGSPPLTWWSDWTVPMSSTCLAGIEAGDVALVDEHHRLAIGRFVVVDGVARDATPSIAVEPVPLILVGGAINAEARSHNLAVLTAAFPRNLETRSCFGVEHLLGVPTSAPFSPRWPVEGVCE